MKKLIFIVNPAAKNGASVKVWNKIVNRLENIPYEVYFSKYKNHAKEMAEALSKTIAEPLLLVAVGGDGTVHEVINGIISNRHVTVAYIPAGSGNDFARGFRLPINPLDCVPLILNMMDFSVNRFDAGFYESNHQSGYFINSLGAGFDAVISQKANQSRIKRILNKLSLGQLIYVFYLLAELFRFKPVKLKMIIDGKEYFFENTWFATISNHPFYGGGMKICPSANPSDGELDITVVHNISKWKILLVFISVFWGGHIRFKEVISLKGKNIIIQSDHSVPIHVDGEQAGVTPVCIKVEKHCWKTIQSYPENHIQSA